MSTVTGKTSSKIDDLLGAMVVAGEINGSGQLILTSQDGSTQNAGTLTTPLGAPWSAATAYTTGDVVGYAGALWRALSNNTNKPPARYTSIWNPITGSDHTNWMDKDPFFTGDLLSQSWDTTYKVGTPTAALTSISGEFETGTQALKVALAPSQQLTAFQKVENIIKGGETLKVTVRARVTSLSSGSDLEAKLMQADDETLYPATTGVVETASVDGPVSLTASWATYTFYINAPSNQPRGNVYLRFRAAANAATMLVDWMKVSRTTLAPISLLDVYPIGSIYMAINNVNPGLLFGGTWSAWGTGRVPIGVDTGTPALDTVEETGGALTHVHPLDSTTSGASLRIADDDIIRANTKDVDAWVPTRRIDGAAGSSAASSVSSSKAVALQGDSASASSLPPYITCYMWKRTA